LAAKAISGLKMMLALFAFSVACVTAAVLVLVLFAARR
jgi:hypothetical protein